MKLDYKAIVERVISNVIGGTIAAYVIYHWIMVK